MIPIKAQERLGSLSTSLDGFRGLPISTFLGRPEIEDLDQFKPRRVVQRKAVALVDHYVDSKGKHRVKGNSQLKVSQAYTQEFLGHSS